MSDLKAFIIITSVLTFVGIGVAGFFVLHNKQKNDANPQALAATSSDTSGSDQSALNAINPNQGQDMPQNQSPSKDQNTSTDAPSATALDPSSFTQYEKYKSGKSALFAEIQKGTGDELVNGKTAAVLYKGWLTNGQLFDQSRTDSSGKLQPFSFTLGAHQVISGWEQAMAGMKVGGTRLLIVPPTAGYGSTATGSIPPNSVLVFYVQLLAVK
jgi:FKBP-type peptidyl-prolyl cis-trans isomerase FkpA